MRHSSKVKNNAPVPALIIGGGLAGLTMAAHLGAQNIPVICLDRDPALTSITQHNDIRTTAISYGSSKILHDAGVWNDLKKFGCPIQDIQILDGLSPVLLEFLSRDVNNTPFGFIIDNRVLRFTLTQCLKKLSSVTYLPNTAVTSIAVDDDYATVTTDTNNVYKAQLLIGADGKNSSLRKYMNAPTHEWSYDQTAFVCVIHHENPHQNIAIEHFRPEGPFAVLPMLDDENGRHRSSIVWTMHGREAEIFKNCDDVVFNAAISARMPKFYGAVRVNGKHAAWPLSLKHAHRYTAPRCVLISESAHAMHPIAGQGLNIGMRDIAELSTHIQNAYRTNHDSGNADLLLSYERARKRDTMMMMAATDSLNKLFSNNIPFLGPLRRMGLRMIEHLPPAKQFFMHQAMGLGNTRKDKAS